MADPARRRMTPDAFFAWHAAQDGLYELVEGVPVLHAKRLDAVSRSHDCATVNIIIALHGCLRGGMCRPTTSNLAIRTGPATLRRPDVTVECAPLIRDTFENRSPRLVVEVLSPSTTDIDRFRKLDEYRRHPSLAYILLVETRFPSTVLYRREGEDWAEESFEGLDAVIALPAIGAQLALADIYEDVRFEPGRMIPTR
ncbi:UNVERIFIED_CONTAM: Uma2 family endonuclease [Methylobacteriaceae bacterium AG10]|nr:Uma2 family endonuclease [Methylobacteriaceae bacterium AG10]